MLTLSFRTKLLLAMMALVVVGSAATLIITQRKMREAYEGLFDDNIQAQIKYIPREQETRLSEVRRRASDVAASEPLQRALAAGDTEELYRVAREEFRKVLGNQLERSPDEVAAAAAQRANPQPALPGQSGVKAGEPAKVNPATTKAANTAENKQRREKAKLVLLR